MKAEIFKPSPYLSRYIDNYMLVDINWQDTASLASVWRLIPYGKVSMLFLYGDSHEYNLVGPSEPMLKTRQAFMVEQLTQPIQQLVNPTGKVRTVPAGIFKFLLPFIKIFDRNTYDKFAFFLEVMQHDTIAPKMGEMPFEAYIQNKVNKLTAT